jgi:RNA polymerase sigma-70 factor (ECF subfamily)
LNRIRVDETQALIWQRRPANGPDSGRRSDAQFGAALNQALPRLRRRALALTGQLALADDVVQDCLERAWRARDTLDNPDMPFSWLSTILRNVWIDWLRRNRHEAHNIGIDEIEETMPTLPIGATSQTLDLVGALQAMTPGHRSILLLAGIEGLSYQEIADELAIPLGTVMSRLARARQALRARLDSSEPPKQPEPQATQPAKRSR